MKLKEKYNYILNRYYKGCNYIEDHGEEAEKYLPVLEDLSNQLEKILEKIPEATREEILNGFKIK